MVPERRPDSIMDRIDRALTAAAKVGRTPVSIVIGKDDCPSFLDHVDAPQTGPFAGELRYCDLPVRLSGSSFLSRLEFKAVSGLPNAVLL